MICNCNLKYRGFFPNNNYHQWFSREIANKIHLVFYELKNLSQKLREHIHIYF